MKKIVALFLIVVVFPLYAIELITPSHVLIAAVQFPELNYQSEKRICSNVINAFMDRGAM